VHHPPPSRGRVHNPTPTRRRLHPRHGLPAASAPRRPPARKACIQTSFPARNACIKDAFSRSKPCIPTSFPPSTACIQPACSAPATAPSERAACLSSQREGAPERRSAPRRGVPRLPVLAQPVHPFMGWRAAAQHEGGAPSIPPPPRRNPRTRPVGACIDQPGQACIHRSGQATQATQPTTFATPTRKAHQ
jgi:hypothetical protein